MALNENALAVALETLFASMEGDPMSNHDYAAGLAKAITDQIKTAEVPSGAVIVSATGGVANPGGINIV
jgi:hypothetical protein